ncbi:hypothetical protein E2C01_082251 [Portunus trituberculatus]|uniref:Uncharacterized protein n=1 Tax=Portunus trituberculatus TaxID=210409 RepID=A0A5B7IRW2_PORTR|nr:hypothetical protein [Portunus trituberculatus]
MEKRWREEVTIRDKGWVGPAARATHLYVTQSPSSDWPPSTLTSPSFTSYWPDSTSRHNGRPQRSSSHVALMCERGSEGASKGGENKEGTPAEHHRTITTR